MSVSAVSVGVLLRSLKLPGFVRAYSEVAEQAEREGWGFERYLLQLAEIEVEDRRSHRIERLLRQSGLPQDKRLSTLELSRLPAAVRRSVPTLYEGGFVDRAENLLAFGLPGRGKTHLVSAIGHELVQRGYQVLFVPAFKLVQRLLVAKRSLELEATLRRLDRFDAVILDDLGYVQQSREEMEVLFTFLAERYERRSVMITSNLVFSEWDKIFQDPMTTACAIDRVVHHAVILELSGPSFRAEEAKRRTQPGAVSGRSDLHRGPVENTPLLPDPHHPGRQSAGVWKAAAPAPPPGTLPHPLENATRFPQPAGHDGDEEEKGGNAQF